ncbi:hypothetical protein F5Y08DRAFT_258000 [Xylaria arbuscula]|nr:hypothetical protein F5Y08DRAFT_258000 [Xylaria arbuscula]
MASTDFQFSTPSTPVRGTEDAEYNFGTPANYKHYDSPVEREAVAPTGDGTAQRLQQTVTSLEQQLSNEKKLRIKAEVNLKGVMKQWKQVAQELSKQQTDAKPFHVVTDDHLKQLTEELRYDVRCFSETYFEDLPPQPWPQQPLQEDGSLPVRVLPEEYEQCPASPTVAQSFLWRVLVKRVFDRYEWPADRSVGIDLYGISKFLRPETENAADHEALRKFHVWRATTANMVFNTDAAVSPKERWRALGDSLITQYIHPMFSTFIAESENQRYYEFLIKIVEKALILDREISRQTAWVRWVFEDANSPAIQGGLQVVMAPALIKRGKSSGDGFEEEVQLLRVDTCEVQKLPPPMEHSSELEASSEVEDSMVGDESFTSLTYFTTFAAEPGN